MIVEAKKLGDPASPDQEGGLTYITADATDQSAYMPLGYRPYTFFGIFSPSTFMKIYNSGYTFDIFSTIS